MKLKTVLDYVPVVPDSKGGPKYGHYADIDPHFAAAKPAADAVMAGLWNADDWTTFRNNWKAAGPLPAGTPQPGTDVLETYQTIPTRDGAQIEIKIMRKAAQPTAADDTVCVLRFHGGGWAIGGHNTEAAENLHAASHANVVLVSVAYRLAPEHPYPVPLHDCVDALRWVRANARSAALGVNPDKIVLLGGSAGSNLALATALRAREDRIPGIRALLLDWPTGSHPKFFPQLRAQHGYELESYAQCPSATVTTAAIMEFFLDAYTPDAQPDPYHSPLLADSFKDLPPTFIQIAGYDPLRDEGLAVAEKLQKDGVPVELHVYKGLPHCFSALFPDLPQSAVYQDRQNAYLDKVIKAANGN